MRKDDSPQIWSDEEAKSFDLSEEDPDEREKIRSRLIRFAQGIPYIESGRASREGLVSNLWLSRCFDCEKVAIWVYDKLLYPISGVVIAPNPDLPPKIRRDYDKAAAILDKSPRGAAAPIRLANRNIVDRVRTRHDMNPERLIADTAYGSGLMLSWLVDLTFGAENDAYTCPAGKELKLYRRAYKKMKEPKPDKDGILHYHARKLDCEAGALKS